MKKTLSLAAIVIMILSTLAFAQEQTVLPPPGPPQEESASAGGGFGAGGSPGQGGFDRGERPGMPVFGDEWSDKPSMGGIDKEELREIARKRMGDKYSDEVFERMMREKVGMGTPAFMDSSQRKGNAELYYDNNVIEYRDDLGPSYEGDSDEMKVHGRIFRLIGDQFNP